MKVLVATQLEHVSIEKRVGDGLFTNACSSDLEYLKFDLRLRPDLVGSLDEFPCARLSSPGPMGVGGCVHKVNLYWNDNRAKLVNHRSPILLRGRTRVGIPPFFS